MIMFPVGDEHTPIRDYQRTGGWLDAETQVRWYRSIDASVEVSKTKLAVQRERNQSYLKLDKRKMRGSK